MYLGEKGSVHACRGQQQQSESESVDIALAFATPLPNAKQVFLGRKLTPGYASTLARPHCPARTRRLGVNTKQQSWGYRPRLRSRSRSRSRSSDGRGGVKARRGAAGRSVKRASRFPISGLIQFLHKPSLTFTVVAVAVLVTIAIAAVACWMSAGVQASIKK